MHPTVPPSGRWLLAASGADRPGLRGGLDEAAGGVARGLSGGGGGDRGGVHGRAGAWAARWRIRSAGARARGAEPTLPVRGRWRRAGPSPSPSCCSPRCPSRDSCRPPRGSAGSPPSSLLIPARGRAGGHLAAGGPTRRDAGADGVLYASQHRRSGDRGPRLSTFVALPRPSGSAAPRSPPCSHRPRPRRRAALALLDRPPRATDPDRAVRLGTARAPSGRRSPPWPAAAGSGRPGARGGVVPPRRRSPWARRSRPTGGC